MSAHQSTNKIYASQPGSPPIIRRSIADSRLKSKDRPAGIHTPNAVNPNVSPVLLNSLSTDKYYASSKAPSPKAKDKNTPDNGLPTNAVSLPVAPPGHEIITVDGADDIKDKLELAVAKLQQGSLVVSLILPTAALVKTARIFFDFQVTRGVLTEDQGRDIRLGLASPTPATITPIVLVAEPEPEPDIPVPTTTVDLDEEEEIDDPAAFVHGDDESDSNLNSDVTTNQVTEPEEQIEEDSD